MSGCMLLQTPLGSDGRVGVALFHRHRESCTRSSHGAPRYVLHLTPFRGGEQRVAQMRQNGRAEGEHSSVRSESVDKRVYGPLFFPRNISDPSPHIRPNDMDPRLISYIIHGTGHSAAFQTFPKLLTRSMPRA